MVGCLDGLLWMYGYAYAYGYGYKGERGDAEGEVRREV